MEYFAKIDEPKKLRISLMIAAKESIIAYSNLERLEDIRQRKLNLLAGMREDFKDASAACKALSELVSDEKTRRSILEAYKELREKETKEIAKTQKFIAQKGSPRSLPAAAKIKAQEAKVKAEEEPLPMPVKKKTDMDRLDYTLSMIEQKLADLTRE